MLFYVIYLKISEKSLCMCYILMQCYMLYNIQKTNYSTDHLEKCFLYVFLMCIIFGFAARPLLTNYFGLGPDVAVSP